MLELLKELCAWAIFSACSTTRMTTLSKVCVTPATSRRPVPRLQQDVAWRHPFGGQEKQRLTERATMARGLAPAASSPMRMLPSGSKAISDGISILMPPSPSRTRRGAGEASSPTLIKVELVPKSMPMRVTGAEDGARPRLTGPRPGVEIGDAVRPDGEGGGTMDRFGGGGDERGLGSPSVMRPPPVPVSASTRLAPGPSCSGCIRSP